LVTAACSPSSSTVRAEVGIYAAVVRDLVLPTDDDHDVSREVFVGERDRRISLEVQAGILQELPEYDHVRFVDDREEAIEPEPPMAARNDGVYLEFSELRASETRASIDVLRYVDTFDQLEVRVQLSREGGTWTVDATERAP
jgi:hypothetical protein